MHLVIYHPSTSISEFIMRDDLFDQPDIPNNQSPIEDPRLLVSTVAGKTNFSSVENISSGSRAPGLEIPL